MQTKPNFPIRFTKKICCALILICILISPAFAQDYVQVGNGTNQDSQLPFNVGDRFTYSQNIFLSSEINQSGLITQISWYWRGPAGVSLVSANDVDIYLATTTKSSFDSNADWVPISEFTQVYHGAVSVWSNNWVTLTFQDPFYYNGIDNLIVAVDENDRLYQQGAFYSTSVSESRGIRFSTFSDTLNPDPAAPPVGTLVNQIANTRFNFNEITCADAVPLTVGLSYFDHPVTGQTSPAFPGTGELPVPTCGNYLGGDFWYTAVVPSNGELVIETKGSAGDTAIQVYTGSCGAMVPLSCDDNSGDSSFSMVNINNPSLAGETIYIRVWQPGNDMVTEYNIAAWSATLPTEPGSSLNFDGGDDIIALQQSFSPIGSTSFTIEAWVKIPLVNTNGLGATERVGVIFGNFIDAASADSFLFEIHDDGQGRIYWNGGAIDVFGTQDLRDNTWHHVACVRNINDNTFKIYIDGVQELSASAGINLNLNNLFFIGGDGRGAAGPNFHGNIDELRVWNVASTETQVNDRMNCELNGNEVNLLAYYKFNQGVAGFNNATENTLLDNSPNANNGTLMNFALVGSNSNWTNTDMPTGFGAGCVDTTPPVITLNGANPQAVGLGAGYTELGATADDGSTVVVDASGFIDALGSYTIYYNATDTNGNAAAEVTRTVNVVDTTAPVITLNGANPQTVGLGAGYTELGATADDGSTVVVDASGFVDALGTYTIFYNATDGSGNEATVVTRTVNVVDATAPVITLNGANPQTIELGSGYTELGATADDGSTVVVDASEFVNALGTYSIYYNATDGSGNVATVVTRTVNVVDTTAPVITLNGANPQTIELGSGYTELGATADDGSMVTIVASAFVNAVGTYTIYYNATDGSGNVATVVTRTVNVVDTTAPVITLNGADPQAIGLGLGYNELGATADDGSTVTIDASEFVDALGSYTIYYNATDASGNMAVEVARTVNVVESVWYLDADGDGYAISFRVGAPESLDGYTTQVLPLTDCDDTNAGINPETLWYLDADGDGFATTTVIGCEGLEVGFTREDLPLTDCDDTNANINPNAEEIVGNGLDDDCDPSTMDTDSDGDGISDDMDRYPNTPNGTIVDAEGGVILAADGIVIISRSPSCSNLTNGSIEVTNNTGYTVEVNVFGNGKNENMILLPASMQLIESLSAGSYDIYASFGHGAPMVYQAVVTDAPFISGKMVRQDKAARTVEYELEGAKRYLVYVNGERRQEIEFLNAGANRVTLQLEEGSSEIQILSDSPCQGKFDDHVLFQGNVSLFPNPVIERVHLNGLTSNRVVVHLFNMAGILVYQGNLETRAGAVELVLAHLPKGSYILNINGDKDKVEFKIIKE